MTRSQRGQSPGVQRLVSCPQVSTDCSAARSPCGIERLSKNADRVVVGLLAPQLRIRDRHQSREAHLMKQELPELRPPRALKHSSIRAESRSRKIAPCPARLAMCQEFIEHFVAGSNPRCTRHAMKEAVVRKFFREGERAEFYLALDVCETLSCAAEIGFRRRALN